MLCSLDSQATNIRACYATGSTSNADEQGLVNDGSALDGDVDEHAAAELEEDW
jgi:hypothetical protein